MDFYENDEKNLIRRISCWVVDIVVAVAFAWFCLNSFGIQVTVSGQSMTPVLRTGDVVLVNRLAYDFGKPKRLDVVVFEREDKKDNVKRVIGIPGDVVQVKDNQIYVNGKLLDDPELRYVSLAGLAESPVELGEKEYFLLGDNRDSSEDSRFANVGNVQESQIRGKVWLRIFPLIDISLIS